MATYLDYNASTPIHPDVLDAMMMAYKNEYGNADSRTHGFGEKSKQAVENARRSLAKLLNVSNTEVFFTSGATESDNIAILGLKEYAKEIGKKHIITTSIEHKAVLEPIKKLQTDGFDITFLSPDKSGSIKAIDVVNSIRDDTFLVSIMHANNETGIIQPVKTIGDYLDDKNILFHIDAAQSFGKLVTELQKVRYDLLSVSAHKMYGPQGVGALVLKKKRYRLPPVHPIMLGGNQEHGLRPGTLPTALIVGFGKAAELAIRNYSEYWESYLANKQRIIELLNQSNVQFEINGDQNLCMPNTLNVSFLGVNSEALMLASRDYCGVSNGSACNSESYKPSYVLSSMGIDNNYIEAAIRMSWGYNSISENDFEQFINAVKSLQ